MPPSRGALRTTLAAKPEIAFFVPGLVYLADAIGTQSEAVAVRGLSLSHVGIGRLIGSELRTGLLIGMVLALLAFPMIWLVFGELRLAAAVTLALAGASIVVSVLGLVLPWLLARARSDPAYGSGPLATIVQDVLSLLIYFGCVSFIVLQDQPARRRLHRRVRRRTDGHRRIERLPDRATALVRKKVDLIVALPTSATKAAHDATRSIPIVGIGIADPVGLGLATSLGRPGGNVTGLTFSVGLEIWGKQLQLLKEAVPSARRVAILSNPGNPGHALGVGHLTAAVRPLGVSLQLVEARAPEDIDGAFAAMTRKRADALLVLGDPLYSSHAERLASLAIGGRLATMHGTRQSIEGGGLMMYAPDLRFQARQAAAFVDKILKGAKPAELAFEQPTKFALVINLKTARALGLTMPPSLLLQADQVLE